MKKTLAPRSRTNPKSIRVQTTRIQKFPPSPPLTPAEAKEQFFGRWRSVSRDLPALIIVILLGGLGAIIAYWWGLSIGEDELAASVSKLHPILRVCLGSVGATAAVFLLARTDTSRLIHCGLIAVLSGMAGPYLVTK